MQKSTCFAFYVRYHARSYSTWLAANVECVSRAKTLYGKKVKNGTTTVVSGPRTGSERGGVY